VVVEVVLAGHLGAGRGDDPGQGVADRGPSRAAQVDRSGGVGGDELEVDLVPGAAVAATVRGAGLHDGPRQLPRRAGFEDDVDEAGAGHLDALDPGHLAQAGSQH
jgi:hypothetical protein